MIWDPLTGGLDYAGHLRSPEFSLHTPAPLGVYAHPGIANTDSKPVLSVDLGYSPALLDTAQVA